MFDEMVFERSKHRINKDLFETVYSPGSLTTLIVLSKRSLFKYHLLRNYTVSLATTNSACNLHKYYAIYLYTYSKWQSVLIKYAQNEWDAISLICSRGKQDQNIFFSKLRSGKRSNARSFATFFVLIK